MLSNYYDYNFPRCKFFRKLAMWCIHIYIIQTPKRIPSTKECVTLQSREAMWENPDKIIIRQWFMVYGIQWTVSLKAREFSHAWLACCSLWPNRHGAHSDFGWLTVIPSRLLVAGAVLWHVHQMIRLCMHCTFG